MKIAPIARGRDCVVFFKGDCYTVEIDDTLALGGWQGGQGVRWTAGGGDRRVVTYSNGYYGGFLLWGSDETGDDFASMTRAQPGYRLATFGAGGWLISTSTYETYTYASRVAHAGDPLVPLVPITYGINDPLYFSLRGLWTNEEELTLSGSPLAPAFFTGFVAQLPRASNRNFLGIQTGL